MRAIASMLNTRGGYLFIGVSDSNIIQGIHEENYDDHDDAVKTLEQHIIRYLGSHQEKFVDIRIIINPDGKEVMVAKIDRCDIPTYMEYFEMDENGGKVKPGYDCFFVKSNQGVENYKNQEQINTHIRTFISPSINSEVVEHELPSSYLIQKSLNTAPSIARNVISCPNLGCNFSGDHDAFDEAMAKCEHKEAGKKEKISENSYCTISYRDDDWSQSWLKEQDQRARETVNLILNTTFTQILFKKDRRSAIDHFMLTNDSSRFEPLNSYDLVSAFVVKLTKVDEGEKMTTHQKKIKKYWNKISQDLYISTRKDSKKINSFFFSWLLATGRRERPAKRYTKDKSWNGVKKEFDNRTDDDGFQYKSIADLFSEMKDFSDIYLRLIDTKHEFWNQDPYNTATCRNEKNLLRIISTIPNEIQHIPPLMCLINRIEKEELDRKPITDFLKNYNYILLRYKSVPGLSGVKAGVVGGDIYTKMQGSENWINDILETDMSTKEGRTKISNLPIDLENKVKNKDDYPWDKDNETWKTLNQWTKGTHEKNDSKVKHILFSVEWALDGNKSPTLAMLHTKGIHVEHILPQDPKLLIHEEIGVCWPIHYGIDESGEPLDIHASLRVHKKYVHSLGNRCLLEDSANSAIGNLLPHMKFSYSKDPKYPFKNSAFKTARKAHERYTESPILWEPPKMEETSMFYMNTIIEKFLVGGSPN